MKTLGVIANCGKSRAGDVVHQIVDAGERLGLELKADPETATLLAGGTLGVMPDDLDGVDALLAVGGDGTMLRVVRFLGGRDKPVMGVNIGGLGFLTSVAEDEIDRALKCLVDDSILTTEIAVARASVVRDGDVLVQYRALNEFVISRGSVSRVVALDVAIEGQAVTSYVCDGLIVSTPAGCTGHSLSAGGPILMPQTSAFVISPICPHTLSSRPLVIPDQYEITVSSSEMRSRVVLTGDGQVSLELEPGDEVHIRRSDQGVRFLQLPGYSYFGVLQQKLHWRGRNV